MTHKNKVNTCMSIRNVYQNIARREDLSFTVRDSETGILDNWAPTRLANAEDCWNRERDLGVMFALQLLGLAANDEGEAFDAIRYAANSTSWQPGMGFERGFMDIVGRFAVVGMRALNDEPQVV